MSEKTIYDLKLHETLRGVAEGTLCVTRVPGGWIYESWRYAGLDDRWEEYDTVFVPFVQEKSDE